METVVPLFNSIFILFLVFEFLGRHTDIIIDVGPHRERVSSDKTL